MKWYEHVFIFHVPALLKQYFSTVLSISFMKDYKYTYIYAYTYMCVFDCFEEKICYFSLECHD